jgi:hypothetical protein
VSIACIFKREAVGSLMVNIDTARYCESNEEVDIDDLEQEVFRTSINSKVIRHTRCFKCLGCELRLTPKAIDGVENQKSAHFAVKHKHDDHESICDIGGYLRFINAKDRKGLYDQGSGFPYGYPSKLELTDRTPGGSGPPPGGEPTGGDGSGRPGSNGLTAKGKHNRTVKTLKLLVKHFIAFPEPEFRRSALTVPRIGVSTYAQAFQYLKWQPGYEYRAVRIYYAEVLWKGIGISAGLFHSHRVIDMVRGQTARWQNTEPL